MANVQSTLKKMIRKAQNMWKIRRWHTRTKVRCFRGKTPQRAVVDSMGHQAVTPHNENASSRDSPVRHMRAPFKPAVPFCPLHGCETRAKIRRMRDACWNATRKLGFLNFHLFFSEPCIENLHLSSVCQTSFSAPLLHFDNFNDF